MEMLFVYLVPRSSRWPYVAADLLKRGERDRETSF